MSEETFRDSASLAPIVWIAGDCWLQPGGPRFDAPQIWGPPAVLSVFVVNLECSVPVGPARSGPRALLPLDPARLRELAIAPRTICVLANNHVSDYGPDGLLATVQSVLRAKMEALGAGATLDEARRPTILQFPGRRVGLLAYADTRPHVGAVAATAQNPGVAPLDADMVISDIRDLARRVDGVWLFLHWGREHLRYPEPEQRRLARHFAQAGAKLIVGIHPHVLRGFERVGSSLVYYSLGNFNFSPVPLADGPLLRWHRESRQGVVLRGELRDQEWFWEHLPYIVAPEGSPMVPENSERRALLQKIISLSQVLDERYGTRYEAIRRRELALRYLRRLSTMTWGERVRLPAHILRSAFQNLR